MVEPISNPDWTALDPAAVEDALGTGSTGLDPRRVGALVAVHGPNAIAESEPPSAWSVLLSQFRSPLVSILLVAMVVTVVIDELIDAGVIFAVLALNAFIGFFQERRAEDAVRSLMGLVAPKAVVVRGGEVHEVDSRDLVPGDVVLLESGRRVPADMRLVATTSLLVDESLLTGESVAVAKHAEPIDAAVAVGDRSNLAHAGTVVTSGRGRGVVVATGDRTELGKIAARVRDEVEPATPLQRRMQRFARVVGTVVVVAAAATIGAGLAVGGELADMFLVGVAVAVSAIPEGLPVVLTVTLAIGVRRMARRRAIIRRLPAVETLGSITTIGSDKTGTLTLNRMTVQVVWGAGGLVAVDVDTPPLDAHHLQTLRVGVLANEATARRGPGGLVTAGDPTETALLAVADRVGLDPIEARAAAPSVGEIPFEPERQYSASFRSDGPRTTISVKGAPERVLAMCATMSTSSGPVPLDAGLVSDAVSALAAQGMRVLAMASGDVAEVVPGRAPSGLTLHGLQGLIDPPRPGVPEAVTACRRAGIRVVMITGDHADTARAIAADLGFVGPDGRVLTGADMESLTDAELEGLVGEVAVFARVSPDHKLRVVRALQARGEVVAVTGDGVNDAPALKVADVGVAMGVSGTDVAREASDMVLADDDFVSIYEAVKEGRTAFDNLRKVTFFLISSGAAEIAVILAAVVAGWPLPMLPAQILWLNLVTNGVQDVALAFEPAERDVGHRPPRHPDEGIVSPLLWARTVLTGLVMAAGTLVLFRWTLDSGASLVQAQTVALTSLVVFQAVHAGNARSERESALLMSPFSNPVLLGAVLLALGIHVVAMHLPFLRLVLRIEPLPWSAWLPILAMSLAVLAVVEVDKAVRRRWGRPAAGSFSGP